MNATVASGPATFGAVGAVAPAVAAVLLIVVAVWIWSTVVAVPVRVGAVLVTAVVVVGLLDVACVVELVVLEPPVNVLMAFVTADEDMVVVPVVSAGCVAILA